MGYLHVFSMLHTSIAAVSEKPKTPDDNRSFNFKAVIGKPAEVVIPVFSLTEPVVSWTQNAGGRLGPWTAVKIGSSQYRLHSTISSTSKTHIGIYGIKVRNDVGSIDLQLELHLTGKIFIHLRFATRPHLFFNNLFHVP